MKKYQHRDELVDLEFRNVYALLAPLIGGRAQGGTQGVAGTTIIRQLVDNMIRYGEGPTSQRPDNPGRRMFWYNYDTDQLEFFIIADGATGGKWIALG